MCELAVPRWEIAVLATSGKKGKKWWRPLVEVRGIKFETHKRENTFFTNSIEL